MKEKRFYYIFTVFIFLIIFLNLDINSNNRSAILENSIVFQDNYIEKNPIIAINDPYRRSDPFFIINEDFEGGLGDWVVDGSGGGSAAIENPSGSNNALYMRAKNGVGYDSVIVTYNIPMYGFIDGNISFDYDYSDSGILYYARCEINGTSGWTPIWNPGSAGSGTFSTNLNPVLTDHKYVNLRFSYRGNDASTYLMIDNLTVGTYEFHMTEINGDPISPYQNQQLYFHTCPNFKDWQGTASVQFKINSSDFSGGYKTVSAIYISILNNFTCTIQESNYTARDIVYYRVVVTSSTASPRNSSVYSFGTIDTQDPVINTPFGGNESSAVYYKDVEVITNVTDDIDGVGLHSVIMYIANDTMNPGPSNIKINPQNKTIPLNGGNFTFIIPEIYLNSKNITHYRIFANDTAGNSIYSSDHSFTVADDIVPNIIFNNINAPPTGIENNESLVVSYIITEPNDASGLTDIKLFVKIADAGSPPSDGTDYNLAPINPDGGINDLDGGIFTFTIDESFFNYSDYIYFFVNATDNDSNKNSTFSDYKTVFSNDTFAPVVVNISSNGNNAIYNQSKTLSFNITEPLGAAGIKPNSINLAYEVGNWDGSGRGFIMETLPLTGGIMNFLIHEKNYTYGEYVYYQLNVSDNANNNYTSIVGYFFVGDPFNPVVNFISYSNDYPTYLDAFNLTFSVSKDSESSQLLSVELYVKNNTGSATFLKIYDKNTTLSGVGGLITFRVNSSITYARYELNWSLIAIDNANNMNNYTGQIIIRDNIVPSAFYVGNNGTGNSFEYFEWAMIYYDISESIDATGFFNDGTGLTLYYKNGTSISSSDYDGSIGVYNASILDYGGIYAFIIPEAFITYGQTIWFWLNASDTQGNTNSTWSFRKNITIIDTIRPTIAINPSSSVQVSYHLDKTISYTPIEPSDASGLKNATLYWKEGSAPTKFDNDGFFTTSYIPGFDGGTPLNWDLSRIALNFTYLKRFYIVIEIYDMAGNNETSSAISFLIIDTVVPDYSENAGNTADWCWRANKKIWITVWDPNYDNSSGIASLTIFYRWEFPASDMFYDYLIVNGSVIPTLASYMFSLPLLQADYNTHQTGGVAIVHYYVKIVDVNGTSRGVANHFNVYNEVFNNATKQGPAMQQWLASAKVFFYVEAYFVTDFWIDIDGKGYYNYYSNVFSGTIDLQSKGYGEGYHSVAFKFLGNVSILLFNFSLDLYPPDKITDFKLTIYGLDVVELTWDDPAGIDNYTIYKIYRSTSRDIQLIPENLFAEKTIFEEKSILDDTVEGGNTYFYVIIAVDRVGHISAPSDILSASIPGNILLTAIIIIVIVAVVGITGFMAYKKIQTKKRERLFSKVDMSKFELDEQDVIAEGKGISGPQWKDITPKTVIKTQEGFQFTEQPTIPLSDLDTYRNNEIGKLLSEAAEYELQGEYGKLLKVYSVLTRLSKRIDNRLLAMSISSKKEEIYRLLHE